MQHDLLGKILFDLLTQSRGRGCIKGQNKENKLPFDPPGVNDVCKGKTFASM